MDVRRVQGQDLIKGVELQPRRRKRLRLAGFDYSQNGAYFVTVCAKGQRHLFGGIVDSRMSLSKSGEVVALCWNEIPDHFTDVVLDAFVVMPNHVHGILLFTGDAMAAHARPLRTVVGSFKWQLAIGLARVYGSGVIGNVSFAMRTS